MVEAGRIYLLVNAILGQKQLTYKLPEYLINILNAIKV